MDALASIQARGWMLCVFLALLAILSTGVNHLFSLSLDVALAVMALTSIVVTYFYRHQPRSLNRLLLMSDSVTTLLLLILLISLGYWALADGHTRASISRVGVVFLIPLPLALGVVVGSTYGWRRWSKHQYIALSSKISERDAYNMFFASSMDSKSTVFWRGIMWLVILLFVILKPVLGDGGILLILLSIGAYALPGVIVSLGIRRYFFLRLSESKSITIV